MIIPDLNLLIYAYNVGAPFHREARAWWEGLVNGALLIGVPWVVTTGFVRVMTHPKVLSRPLRLGEATSAVEAWFERPHVTALNPGSEHWKLLRECLEAARAGADLVTDAHIAALGIEYQAEVHTNDSDFARFPGLRAVNPLV